MVYQPSTLGVTFLFLFILYVTKKEVFFFKMSSSFLRCSPSQPETDRDLGALLNTDSIEALSPQTVAHHLVGSVYVR